MQVNFSSSYNRPAFGMAVKLDPSAQRIVKAQTSEMSEKVYNKFWEKFDEIVARQEENPVDVLIRAGRYRDRLIAEVVDHGESPVKNSKYSQNLLLPSGLKFLEKAEVKANRLNDVNDRIGKYTPATKQDYVAGKITEELESDGANLDLDV